MNVIPLYTQDQDGSRPELRSKTRESFVNFEISREGDLRSKTGVERVLCAVKSLKPDLITFNINTPTKQVWKVSNDKIKLENNIWFQYPFIHHMSG